MDYVSFCGAVEPRCGGRDLDNKERELEKAWKKKPVESNSAKAVTHASNRKYIIAAGKRRISGGGGGRGGVEGQEAVRRK